MVFLCTDLQFYTRNRISEHSHPYCSASGTTCVCRDMNQEILSFFKESANDLGLSDLNEHVLNPLPNFQKGGA